MRTYWDLSEQERAALTEEDMQRFIDAELMTKGVLKVKPLELEPVPTMPPPDAKVFAVRVKQSHGYGKDLGVAFTTLDAANKFVELRPMRIDHDWLGSGSGSIEFVAPPTDYEVAEVPIFSESMKDAMRAELKRAAVIRDANERRRTEHATAMRTQEEALRDMWSDWTACREAEAKLRAVAETFADYARTAGDEAVAARFLAKVYPQDLIHEAAERFGFPVQTVA